MRAHYLQHVPFEGLGSIGPWLETKGYEVTCTRFFESADLPAVEVCDLLVVMGGPMSVNDEAMFPWLVAEKRFVREFIHSGKPVLGICLGAQMIASALGARVFANPVKEIGWWPVHSVDARAGELFRFPDTETVFHWHGETFDLPPGAVRLARSDACENQAFQIGASVIGLQFHLETTQASATQLVAHCGDELKAATYVQTAEQILSVKADRYAAINTLMGDMLGYLARGDDEQTRVPEMVGPGSPG